MHQLTRKFSVIAALASGFLILILAIISPSVIRIALVLPLLLFLPGYGITALLFQRRALDIPARLLLSVGLSLATTAFSGLILHLTPRGIQLQNPWAILLLGGTGLVGLYFLIRDALNLDRTTIRTRIGLSSRQVLLLVSAAVIAALAVNISRTPTSPKNLEGYTLLWVQSGNLPDRLEVGVRSEEFEMTEYQLRLEIKEDIQDGPTFELRPGETWRGSIELEGSWMADQPVTLLLYRLDKPSEVYRRVVWWYENN